MQKSVILFLFVFLLSPFHPVLMAQSTVKIQGQVFSSDGQPLEGANVFVEGSNYGDATDAWGWYEIAGVPPGSYRLRCRLIGYKEAQRRKVEVKTDITTKVNFYLQPDTLLLEEITVTGEKSISSLAELAPSVEVITAQEIQKSSAQTIAKLLETVAGVFVKSYGPAGARQVVSMRGSEGNQVLVLIDGQRFASAQNGAADLNAIPVSAIESIEILKGGASALFGSNAMAGVINIRTKSASRREKLQVSQHSSFGSFDTRELAARLEQAISQVKYNLAFDWLASDGDFEFVNTSRVSKPVQTRKNADFQSYNGFAKLQWLLGKSAVLDLSGQVYHLESGTPGEIANPTPFARSEDTRYLSRVTLQQAWNKRVHFAFTGFYNVFENRFRDPELSYLNGQNQNISLGLDLKQTFRFQEGSHVTAGFGFSRDEVTGTNIAGDPVRDNLSLFVHSQIEFAGMPAFFESATLYPALRFDHFSEFGSEVSPKLGLLLGDVLMPNLNLKANIGRSFRVPSFNSLFFVSSVQVRSNPDLQPERSFDLDIGFNYRLTNSKYGKPELDITYFRRHVDGTILWLPDFRFIWRPRNISKVVSQGVEATLSWRSADDKVLGNVNYTFTDARFDLPGNRNPVPYRPEHQFNLELGVELGRIAVNAHQRWVSERFPNVAGTNAIPGYRLTDVNISTLIEIGKFKLTPKLVVTNLFSEDYQVVSNFPMPGREFHISLSMNY